MKQFEFDFGSYKLEMTRLWFIKDEPIWNSDFHDLIVNCDSSLRSKFSSKEVGFYDWPTSVNQELVNKIRKTAQWVRQKFDCAVIFGIGGSHLGAASVLDAIRDLSDSSCFPIHWINNIDPFIIRKVEHEIKNRKPIFIAISKSGGTVETLAGFFYFSKFINGSNLIFITDPEKGYLRELSRKLNVTTFEVPSNIGGRFSVFTPVGLLPIEIGNISCEEFLDGACKIKEFFEKTNPQENPAYLLALSFYLWDTKYRHSIQYLMPYWSNLKLFADWFVQLWGESLGKKTSSNHSVGFTPVSAMGTTDQHSLLQLLKEGPSDKIIGFIDVEKSNSPIKVGRPSFEIGKYEYLLNHTFDEISRLASIATEKSLNNALVPTYRISIKTLNARTIGSLLFFFELSCAFAGELYKVNAFNQPGVEESKTILQSLLKDSI